MIYTLIHAASAAVENDWVLTGNDGSICNTREKLITYVLKLKIAICVFYKMYIVLNIRFFNV